MGRTSCMVYVISLFLSLYYGFSRSSSVSDSVTLNRSIRDGQTLVSKGKIFELGFFTSGDGSNRCVGIWYAQLTIRRVVWVANGDKPVTDSSGVFTIGGDGNLVVLDGRRNTLWSTNAATVSNNSVAFLSDSGNLVLRERSSGSADRVIWQSFDFPTDTLLPGMKIGLNRGTRRTQKLISWKGYNDPSSGSFSFGIDPQELLQFFIFKGSEPYYRSIYWNGTTYKVLPEQNQTLVNFTVTSNENGVFLEYSAPLTISPSIVMDPSGRLNYIWYEGSGDSITERSPVWSGLAHSCEEFGACGVFSSCNQNWRPMCRCLPGFEPASSRDWNSGDWSGGCRRKRPLQCRGKDGFLVLPRMRVAPPVSDEGTNTGVEACRTQCLRNCSCTAYANVKSGGNMTCRMWNEDLQDAKDGNEGDGEALDLYLRLSASELENAGRRCENCGTSIIPYPLSTGSNCGDPAYSSFSCNSTTGQLQFHALDDSSYAITSVNAEQRTFVIQSEDMNICWPTGVKSKDVLLNSSLPFYLNNRSSVLLFNCTHPQLSLPLNCTSNLCEKYVHEGPAACINSSTCCSQMVGSFSGPKSYSLGVLHTGCGAYASVVNANLSSPARNWQVGVEIGWEPPLEPVCSSSSDCRDWQNSTCLFDGRKSGTKRCICSANLKWNPWTLSCTKDNIKIKGLEVSSHSKRPLALIIPVTIIPVFFLAGILTFCSWRMMGRKKGTKGRRSGMSSSHLGGEDMLGTNETEELDIPFFELETVAAATGGFSETNKLGQGGFGPVYKGKLPGGQEIAVKRLSQRSGQGLEEFKNEIMLIAKLQHRNLVRLLGYSIAGDEKMILYEFMSNKSLDFFLFEKERSRLLDWRMRFNIVLGIARGLLYLHQDSRLRIIHRDLKAGNVLLDEEMNPKISDFGMARMFGGNQLEANTGRVVGTYGYMSPEYALHGRFSVKSDVYSFGVMVLEIVSGKKNTVFYNSQESLTLLGHAWRLWNEDKGLDLVGPQLRETCTASEVLNCIRIGLLCVQEDPADRPNMASVVTMLNNEAVTPISPKKPAFSIITAINDSSGEPSLVSINDITISTVEGR